MIRTRDRDASDVITPLLVQKLVFFVQAWFRSNKDRALFSDDFQAWASGPGHTGAVRALRAFRLCVLDLARSGATGLVGVASLHGTLNDNGLDGSAPITAKVLVEHGWLDPFTPPEKVLCSAKEMNDRDADWQLHVHGRAMHAFTEPGAQKPEHGMAYDADADRRSWASTMTFLEEVLRK